MHLFKIYPKSIDTIKLFQEKLMNGEFYDGNPRDGIFTKTEGNNTLLVNINCHNVAGCFIMDNKDNIIDQFIL